MTFNVKEHQERLRIINHGRTLLPFEKNITRLYEAACKDLGIEIKTMSTTVANHLPTPIESAKQDPGNKFTVICPECGEKSYVIHPICPGCKDSENGKFKTMLICYKCNHKEKSEKWLAQWMKELEVDLPNGMKARLGIKTVTNEGLK